MQAGQLQVGQGHQFFLAAHDDAIDEAVIDTARGAGFRPKVTILRPQRPFAIDQSSSRLRIIAPLPWKMRDLAAA